LRDIDGGTGWNSICKQIEKARKVLGYK